MEEVCSGTWLAHPRYKSGQYRDVFKVKHDEAIPSGTEGHAGYNLDVHTLFVVTGFCKVTLRTGNVTFDQTAFKDAWRVCWEKSELERSCYMQVVLTRGDTEMTVLSVVEDEDFETPLELNTDCVDVTSLPPSMNARTENQLSLELVASIQLQDPLAMVYFSPLALRGAVKVNRLLLNGALSAPQMVIGLDKPLEEAVSLLLVGHAAAMLKAECKRDLGVEEDAELQEEEGIEQPAGRGDSVQDLQEEIEAWKPLQ